MIQISNINKTFNKTTSSKVLNNTSVRFDRGNIYGLNGNNGSGKTTLLKIIAGLLLQDDGEILLDSDIDAKDIKYVNNNPRSFNNRLSAKENLQYFYAISSGKSLDKIVLGISLIVERFSVISSPSFPSPLESPLKNFPFLNVNEAEIPSILGSAL